MTGSETADEKIYRKLHDALLFSSTPLLLLDATTGIWVPLNMYRMFVLRPVERRAYPEEQHEQDQNQ